MSIRNFCGTYSLSPWENDSLGLCFLEVYIHYPLVVVYFLLSIIYCFIYRKYLAFEFFQSGVFWFRLTIDTCVVCNGAAGLAFGYALPYFRDIFSGDANFIVVHSAVAVVLWGAVSIQDVLLGKSTDYSSRGPLSHLLCSVIYFYVCVASVWSAFRQVAEPWRPYILTFFCIHLLLVCLHLISRVPVIYSTEEPRRRAARIARTTNRAHSAHVLLTTSQEIPADPQNNFTRLQSGEPQGRSVLPGHISEDHVSNISKIFYCWMSSTIQAGYYGELCSVSNLPQLPSRLNVWNLESNLPTKIKETNDQIRPSSFVLDPEHQPSSVKTSWPFIKTAFAYFGREFIILGVIKFMLNIASICGPVVLNRFIAGLGSNETKTWATSLWGVGLVIITFVASLVGTSYNYRMSTFGYKIRVSVTGMVYRSILSARISSLHSIGTGSLINFLTSDADRIVNLAPSVHEVWAMPLQVILAIVLLYQQLGISCLVGIAFLVILLPLNRLLANQIGKISRRLMRFKDARIKLMSEILPSMAAVKLACWENLMRKRVGDCRKQELRALWGQKMLDAGCVFCWAACPALLASSTFATYVLLGNRLEASIIFTSLALFGMLIGPMNAFPWVINGVIEAAVSIQRISLLLHLPRGPFPEEASDMHLKCLELVENMPNPDCSTPVNMKHASFYWKDPENLVLSDITFSVLQGQFVGVLGAVGSGKSALLLAILGELQSVNGDEGNQAQNGRLKYAYVGQTPWLCTGTVRDNIVFGAPALDPDWLNKVVYACALELDIANLPHGLDTDVGEGGGSRLSGGQRARVALARAVYQNADVYLLDDPVAALDVHVGEHVVQHCLLGLLAHKTRIITSHQANWSEDEKQTSYLRSANLILELDHGQIVKRYHPNSEPEIVSNLPAKPLSVLTGLPPDDVPLLSVEQPQDEGNDITDPNEDRDDVKLIDTENSSGSSNHAAACLLTARSVPGIPNEEFGEATDWEKLAFGSISGHVYWAYLKAVGYCLAFSIVLSLILMQGSRNAADWWLAHWVQSSPSSQLEFSNLTAVRVDPSVLSTMARTTALEDDYMPSLWTIYTRIQLPSAQNETSYRFYLTVYGAIVGGNVLATTFRAVLFAIGGLAAATTVHQLALDTMLHGRLSYFDRTPHGRILNRFSADVGTVDDALPFQLNILLADIAGLIGTLVITCIALPSLFFMLLPLVFVFWSVQRFYRGAARDLKRISSVTRSPVYAHFSDTLAGLAVIRGLSQQERFRRITVYTLASQLRAELASLAAGAWLSIRLQLIACTVVGGVVCLSLLGRVFHWTEVAAAGLSAAYALTIAGLMTSTVYDATETEKSLVAVERCQELADDTPVESDTVPTTVTAPTRRHRQYRFRSSAPDSQYLLPTGWPSEGRIEFRDVSLTYRRTHHRDNQHDVQSLDSVSFTVKGGQHVGIVGRTGAGKSSLMRVLLRLVDHLPGPHTNQHIASQLNFVGASGQVFIDGIDIRTVPLEVLRSSILAIGQEPFLFSGWLRDNLDPDNELKDDELIDVLIKCQVASNQTEAEEWLHRDVGEAGRDISAGQRQLICLARGLLKKPRPRIVCLDEATAAVDDRSEEAIHNILGREFAESTVVLIAHRLSSIRRLCSHVIVMHSGHIVAEGDPEKLLAESRIQIGVDNEIDLITL